LAVVDASVLAVFYAVDDSRHVLVAERLKAGDALFAPAHLDAEIVSALRGMARGNKVLDRTVPAVLIHLGHAKE
jgi:predicted nucleic acid-binding protein